MPCKLNKELKEQINRLFQEGLSTSEIAKTLGLPYTAVYFQRPEVRERMRERRREYFRRPEVRERRREWRREYYQRPEVRERMRKYSYKRLLELLNEILNTTLPQKYGDDIRNKILQEFSYVYVKGFSKKRNRRVVLAAVTYATLRKSGEPVLLGDVSEWFGIKRKNILTAFNAIYRDINGIPPQNPKSYIERGATDLNFSENAKRLALDFYENNKDILMRFAPNSCAAVCLYLASKTHGLGKTQKEIAQSLKITDVTLKNVMKILEENGRLNFDSLKNYNIM